MHPRKILLTVLAAAALAAAAVLLLRRERPAEPQRPLAEGSLTRIELGPVVLEKAAGRWRLAAPVQDEADASAAAELESGLRDLSLGSEVSQDPAGWPDYELDEARAVRARVFAGPGAAPLLDGWFGKDALGGASYFRRDREPAVYLAEGLAPHLLRRSAEELRSRSLLPCSLDELESLRVERPVAFTVARASAAWTVSDGALSQDRAAQLVLSLTTLRFSSFAGKPEPDRRTGFDRPALAVIASAAGRSERILIGKVEGTRRWAKAEGRQVLGFVAKDDAEALLKLLKP